MLRYYRDKQEGRRMKFFSYLGAAVIAGLIGLLISPVIGIIAFFILGFIIEYGMKSNQQ